MIELYQKKLIELLQNRLRQQETHREIIMSATSIATKKPTAEVLTNQDISVLFSGEKIILPTGMSLPIAIEFLRRKHMEGEQNVDVREPIECHPIEGAYALTKALRDKFGWTSLANTPTFFGPKPPSMISAKTDVDTKIQIPWGRMNIPGVEGYIQTGVTKKDGQFIFELNGVVQQRYKEVIAELMQLARYYVKHDSIYKGKAIKIKFQPPTDDFSINDNVPDFIDTKGTNINEILLNESVKTDLQTNVFTLIDQTDTVKRAGIPLKRGILFEGPYGTGKTLAAGITAAKCVKAGWTYIYLNSVEQLDQAILFAANYQPAVIFSEDIDQVIGDDDRNEKINQILNKVDGVDTKAKEIMIVLTTNHVITLNKALMRPGRLDAIISFVPPDKGTIINLIKMYSRGTLDPSADLNPIAEILDGHIPAVVREVTERAKLAAISRDPEAAEQALDHGKHLYIIGEDLVTSARTMAKHLDLMKPKETVRTMADEIESLAVTIAKMVKTKLNSE